MGRYYTGNNDIEGKFWFGVQSSDDGEFFGMVEQEPNYINYYTEDLKRAEQGVKECKKQLGGYKAKLDQFFKENNGYNEQMLIEFGIPEDKITTLLEWYARLELGLKIVKAIEKDGYCEIEAEI